jgi:hypothetical protein
MVLDAGAFLAIERGDREMIALVKQEWLEGRGPVSHGGVIGQVWRGGSGRQANLARVLPGIEVTSLDEWLGRSAGVLLGEASALDVIDAAVVLLAHDGDEIFTSDAGDLEPLAETAGIHVDLVPV